MKVIYYIKLEILVLIYIKRKFFYMNLIDKMTSTLIKPQILS